MAMIKHGWSLAVIDRNVIGITSERQRMGSDQYEELCRCFIAEQVGLNVEDVKSVSIPNPRRPGFPEYKHQIDLYWEVGNTIAVYLNIANAKWRKTAKIKQGEIMQLRQVCQQVAAHKAFMITNVGFTAGAIAAAKDHGIALHVVKPAFEASEIPRGDRVAIQAAMRDRLSNTAKPLYVHRVEHRGLGFDTKATVVGSAPSMSVTPSPGRYKTRVMSTPSQRISEPTSNRSIGGGETRGGFSSTSVGRDEGNFSKR